MNPIIRLRPLSAAPSVKPDPLVSFFLQRSLEWPAGMVDARFPGGTTRLAIGAKVVAEGSTDGTTYRPLFTGTVSISQSNQWETYATAEEATGPLTRLRVEKVIEAGTASAAIADLCKAAGVTCTAESPGAKLTNYLMLDHESAMDHILNLAKLSGFLARTDTSGKLLVGKAPATAGGVIVQSNSVLGYDVLTMDFKGGPGTFAGDGAVAEQGAGTEHWVTQAIKSVKAGEGLPLNWMPALHHAAAATAVATAEKRMLSERRNQRRLTLDVLPPADLGEVIEMKGFHSGNGLARVAGIDIMWDVRAGLVCSIDLYGLGG